MPAHRQLDFRSGSARIYQLLVDACRLAVENRGLPVTNSLG